jgi:hypothetical protein
MPPCASGSGNTGTKSCLSGPSRPGRRRRGRWQRKAPPKPSRTAIAIKACSSPGPEPASASRRTRFPASVPPYAPIPGRRRERECGTTQCLMPFEPHACRRPCQRSPSRMVRYRTGRPGRRWCRRPRRGRGSQPTLGPRRRFEGAVDPIIKNASAPVGMAVLSELIITPISTQ